MMSEFLPRYFGTATQGPGMGTTAADLSPTQKLGVMGRELGTMGGQLAYNSKLSDYLGGQMNDMYNSALQAAQMGQQNLADQYSRAFQQYQLAWQQAEAEKDRQLQRELTRSSDDGGFNPSSFEEYFNKALQQGQAQNFVSSIAQQIESSVPKKGITKEKRFLLTKPLIDPYIKYLSKEQLANLYAQAGFSDKWNPAYNPEPYQKLTTSGLYNILTNYGLGS